jgi:hypothetical protein
MLFKEYRPKLKSICLQKGKHEEHVGGLSTSLMTHKKTYRFINVPHDPEENTRQFINVPHDPEQQQAVNQRPSRPRTTHRRFINVPHDPEQHTGGLSTSLTTQNNTQEVYQCPSRPRTTTGS